MSLYIQSKVPPRQSKLRYPGDDYKIDHRIDVTSGQLKANRNRIAFSPMTPIPDGCHGFHCYENFWQSGKRYTGLGHRDRKKKQLDIARWKTFIRPYRRHPDAKGMIPFDAIYPDVAGDKTFNYIDSRKQIYVPFYYDDVLNTNIAKEQIKYYQQQLALGKNILVVDYDGPKVASATSSDIKYSRPCLKVTIELLQDKINDPRWQFGHGYVVAATILGITPDQYTK